MTKQNRIGISLIAGICGLAVLMGCSSVKIASGPRVTQADLQKIRKVAVLLGAPSASPGGSGGQSGDPLTAMLAMAMAEQGRGSIDTFNDQLVIDLMGIGLEIVERKQLDKITNEQALSLSGLTDSDKSVVLGKVLAVDAIIIGNLDVRQEYHSGWVLGVGAGMKDAVKNATIKMLDVEKGNTLLAVSVSYSRGVTQDVAARDIANALKQKMGR
jgi:curli biogenesis system outer membrane secretion channel CsgG